MTRLEARIDAAWNRANSLPPLLIDWWPLRLVLQVADLGELAWNASQWRNSVGPRWEAEASEVLSSVDDSALYEAIAGTAAEGSEASGYGRAGLYRLVESGSSRRVWWSAGSDELGRHAVVFEPTRGWLVISTGDVRPRKALKRVASELVLASALSRGGAVLHSATARHGNLGLVFVGDSGAGKTTAALAAAKCGLFVSGDRTGLVRVDGQLRAVGFPDATRIGLGFVSSLGLEPVLTQLNLLRPQNFRHGDSVAAGAREYGSRAKVSLTRTELEVLLGLLTTSGVAVDALVLVERARTHGPQVMAAEGGGIRRVAESVIRPGASEAGDWLFEPRGLADGARPADAHAVVRRLLGGVPVLTLRWDPESQQAEDALEAVTGSLGKPVVPAAARLGESPGLRISGFASDDGSGRGWSP